jgi:hypothetical protein
MASRLETIDSTVYLYTPDPPAHEADRWRSVCRARVVDEITREPIAQGIGVSSERPDLMPRIGSDGLVGLIARPERVLPMLATTAAAIRLSVTASGYLPVDIDGTLGPIPGFPLAFSPLDFGDVGLHRPGVTLAGRVVRNLTTTQPISGATVKLDGFWSTMPPPNWTPPALIEAPNLVSLYPGLYASRASTANIARRDLTLSAQTKTLVRPLTAGQTRLRLSDRVGLASGTVLVLDRDDPMRIEAIEIAQVDTISSADQPASLTLAHPVKQLHRPGQICTAATPQAPQTPTTFTRAGSAGDAVAHLAAAPAFAAGVFVEIGDGLAVREFQRIDRYEATTDAAGFFRLPPIARIAFARLLVQHAGFTNALPIVTIDYRSAIQHVTVPME